MGYAAQVDVDIDNPDQRPAINAEMRMLNLFLAALLLSTTHGRNDVPLYGGGSKMVGVAEMTESADWLANARIVFGHTMGFDDEPHDTIVVKRAEGPDLTGEFKYLYRGGNDFDIEIGPFGYTRENDVGAVDRRRFFSATECKAIEALIRSFFAEPDTFTKEFGPLVRYLGGLTFQPNWILQKRTE